MTGTHTATTGRAHGALLCLGLIAGLLAAGCVREETVQRTPFRQPDETAAGGWDEYFEPVRTLGLAFAELEVPVLSIGNVLLDRQGDLVLPDGKNHRILVIDREQGTVVKVLGGKGQGPGEFSVLGPTTVDAGGTLLAFDLDGRRVSLFAPPDYEYSGFFILPVAASLFVSGGQQDLLVYSPTEKTLLQRFDRGGQRLATQLTPGDEKLRLFLGRFHTGGIAPAAGGDLFAIYPEDFVIYRYDRDLRNVAAFGGGGSSRWRPSSPAFPGHLSPYEFGPAHRQWWEDFLHVGRLYSLEDGVLGVTLFEASDLSAKAHYLNLYTTDGEVVAEGLSVPGNGQVVGAGQGSVFVATSAYITDEGAIVPADLREYRLRPRPGARTPALQASL